MVTIFRRALLLSAAIAAPALGQGFENLEMLDSRVAAALGANVGEPGGPAAPLDRRLRLAACPEPATIEEPAMNAVTVRCPAQGWRIRVPLAGGGATVTRAAAVRAEPVIRRGDQVEVVALSRSFSVSTTGIAEQDGAPGDRIRVRTERRSAPFIGQVTQDGRVALPGFN
ncbi:flagellar basal body P-ring formation chaperone FlgA [Sphingosinicella sp. LHD-64]|uniref:flagellar basal body P-ring formation chaperone FlgA n=1 Tax=Sphingosinicella sp. LHD-64 TaxID=3072139 RepID=UPI00280F8E50|nr:flagellar basal body P-ring formation chaperone FlgA [Sphingosinicella sp. LHD-64]MDQ8757180.1 flagellar basal body P-ring formation chaperone FlgA [Sphingosinicella sp. LHD-64]